jgi:class 3 adenylate cyclase/pimeloyl-ACP methyl ester carboxylesterase
MQTGVRYCTTSDSVRIAYRTMGDGPAFVHLPLGDICDIQREIEQPEIARWYELLAGRYTLVRYDMRGFGSSQRDVPAISLETMLLDIEAVVDALNLERFALFGVAIDGAVAAAFAERHPARVSRLVMWNPSGRRSERRQSPEANALEDVITKDWKTYTNASMQRQWGWSRSDQARRWARMLSASTGPETYQRYQAAWRSIDVAPLLPRVAAPTLVVKHRANRIYSDESVIQLASRMPNAQFLASDSPDYLPWLSEASLQEGFDTLTQFIDGAEARIPAQAPATAPAIRAVLFTDLVAHVEMMARLGDAKGRDVLREHERITRETLAQHSGNEIKTMGDGFMASFGSVTRAMECALALQRAFAAWNDAAVADGAAIQVRVGLNAGEPIEEDGDLFGATVILASRICAHADAGEVLIPEAERHLLAGKGFVFEDRGQFVPKGYEEEVRLFAARWRD